MSEGVVAGRLEVPVESNTRGFGDRLKAAIEKETANVVAKVGVEWDADTLRKRLEAAVDKAAVGVKAHIEAEVDTKKVRAELAGLKGKVQVRVEGLSDDVRRQSLKAKLLAKKNAIEVPLRTNGKGFFAELLATRAAGQAAVKRKPIKIPMAPESGRSAFMPLLILSIASVIQPAIAAIVGSIGGLVAMVGNLGTALGTLAGAPALLGGVLSIFGALKVAFSGMTGDIKKLPKPMAAVRREVASLSDEWGSLKKSVQTEFWSQLEGKIRPVAEKVLPDLSTGLSMVSKTLGGVAAKFAAWVGSDEFAYQFPSVMRNGNVLAGALGNALIGLAKGTLNLSMAAEPLTKRLGKVIDRFGEWAAAVAAPGKKQDQFVEFLDYAADKAGQLWDMLKNLAGGFAGVFRAGRESGDELLGSLQGVIDRWHKWVDSDLGQKEIKDWFNAVKPITEEAGRLIADIGKSILRLAKDPNTATLLSNIRTQLLPLLERFLTNLGSTLGPKVIDFLTQAVSILTEFSAAGGPLANGLGVINGWLENFGDLLTKHPDMAKQLGAILGALLAYRALAFIGKATGLIQLFELIAKAGKGGGPAMFTGLTLAILPFTGALGDMNPVLQGAVAAFGAFLTLRSTMPAMQGIIRGVGSVLETMALKAMIAGDNYRLAVGKFKSSGSSGFGAAAKAIGTSAKSGLRGALTGLGASIGMGAATGGPIGIAIGVVTGLVGVWATAHANAKQKAQEYKDLVSQIADSLDRETGALTDSTKATIAKKLQDSGAADSAQKLGLNLADLTDAAMGNAAAQDRVHEALKQSAVRALDTGGKLDRMRDALVGTGFSVDDFTEAALQGDKGLSALQTKIERTPGLTEAMRDSLLGALDVVEHNTGAQQDLAAQLGSTTGAVRDAIAAQAQMNDLTGKSRDQVNSVTKALQGLPAGKTTTVKALTKTAEAQLRAMGYKVTHMPDGSVTITATATTRAAEAALNYAARNRTAHISASVDYHGGGQSWAGGLTKADGGIVNFSSFANGGLLSGLRKSVQSFANGAEQHIAQIARPGEWRLWAEPETGGEAYIPLAESKRKRSLEILSAVAERFGFILAPKFAALASALGPSGPSAMTANALGSLRTSTGDLSMARSAGIVFEDGAIRINNPAPEPAGKSISDTLRNVGAFGLFDQEG